MTRMKPDKPHDFEAVGLDDLEEEVYRTLLDEPKVPIQELAASPTVSAKELNAVLASLEAKGLIARSADKPTTYVPTPPDIAMDILIRERQADLEAARLAASKLAEQFRVKQEKAGFLHLVEVIRGREAIGQMFDALQRKAKKEILGFDRPPYAAPTAGNPLEEKLLSEGIRYRVIYHPEALTQPGQPAHLQRLMDAGEDARVHADLPMKMALVDSFRALIPLRPHDPTLQETLVVYPSPLLDALRSLFDLLWERAVPVPRMGESEEPPVELSPHERKLLALLTAGLKDQSIANQMGIAPRTAERHVAKLMRKLGSRSRFQAGVQAARRGWVPPG